MEYKTNRNLKIRAFDPLGTVFYLAGLILIANSIEVGSGETNPGVIIGALLFIPGVYLSSLVTTDLSCNTCTGVILESKSISKTQGRFPWLVREQSRVHSNSTFIFDGG